MYSILRLFTYFSLILNIYILGEAMFYSIVINKFIINLFIPLIFEILNIVLFNSYFNYVYIFYGISSYIIYSSKSKKIYKQLGYIFFLINLILLLFLNLFYIKYKLYYFCLIWSIIVILSLFACIYFFKKINKKACIFLIPALINIIITIYKICKLL